jgi:hypothetical protein
MKKLICALALLLPAGGAHAQKKNPKLELPPGKFSILLPDLLVESVEVLQGSNGLMQGVTINFKNGCKAAAKGKFDLTLTIKGSDKAGAKVLHTNSSTFDGLGAGESHGHFFSVENLKLPMTSFVRVEIDPANKIKEDTEFNNWMERNPNRAPFPPNGATYCKPKS